MNAAKRLGFVAMGCLVSSMANAWVWDEHAKQLLLRSLQHAYNVNVRAIVVQYCSETRSLQQMKVEQTKNGKSRYTVLTPLRDQGVESIDDGTKAVTFLPDSKLVLVQASARNQYLDAKDRISCAEKNYRLTWEKAPQIAGRPTVCVTATPKSGPLDQRRFYIDMETAYLLRAETVSKGGVKQVKYDTKCVSYPEEMVEPGVSIDAFGARTVKYEREVTLSKSSPAGQLGFDPIIPSQLPYGFRVNAAQITKSENWNAVVVRVTDGLVTGSVYEWKPTGDMQRPEGAPDRSSANTHGLNLLLVADIPRGARERILQAFVDSGAQVSFDEFSSGTVEPKRGTVLFHNLVGLRSTSRLRPLSSY